MDNELDEGRAVAVREHLALCAPCAKICEELAALLDLCKSGNVDEIVPPNPDALWCRIHNIIESEVKPELPPVEPQKPRRFWRFTLPQLASAVLCIAIVSSLLTIIGIKNYLAPRSDDFTSRSSESQTILEKFMARLGLIDTPQKARERRLDEQRAAIEYWDRRVLERRAQWNAVMQEKFDKNLNIIDESVNDYTRILQQNPDDEITGEMLDSAMDEKMQLLREFAEL
jgi:hypothetical protein